MRQQANLFINLFSLLLPAGLYREEELSVVRRATPSTLECFCPRSQRLTYACVQMRQRFNLEEEDEVAATIFRALIVDSLGSLSTKFNWAIHTAKHVGL